MLGIPTISQVGMRIEAEKTGDNTVIHNYGHGGAASRYRGEAARLRP